MGFSVQLHLLAVMYLGSLAGLDSEMFNDAVRKNI